MHKNAWKCIHHEDHYICHQHHRHYSLQANIQSDYEASSLKRLRLSLVFVTVMYLRNWLGKTYDSLIMVIYSRTIDILFVAIVVASLHVYIITTWLLTHDPHDSYPWWETKYLHMGHIIASSELPSTNFRQSGDACVKVFVKRGNVQPISDIFWLIKPAWQSPLYI